MKIQVKVQMAVENNIKIIRYLDIQIEDLEEEIKNAKSINERIKLNIQKKRLILKQLEQQ